MVRSNLSQRFVCLQDEWLNDRVCFTKYPSQADMFIFWFTLFHTLITFSNKYKFIKFWSTICAHLWTPDRYKAIVVSSVVNSVLSALSWRPSLFSQPPPSPLPPASASRMTRLLPCALSAPPLVRNSSCLLLHENILHSRFQAWGGRSSVWKWSCCRQKEGEGKGQG